MEPEKIKGILLQRYNLGWKVPHSRHIYLTNRAGFCASEPICDEDQIKAIADLIVKRYGDGKRITINALTIEPDLSAPTQEELLEKVGEGTIWRRK